MRCVTSRTSGAVREACPAQGHPMHTQQKRLYEVAALPALVMTEVASSAGLRLIQRVGLRMNVLDGRNIVMAVTGDTAHHFAFIRCASVHTYLELLLCLRVTRSAVDLRQFLSVRKVRY